jgi:hypothetical protein
MQVLDRSLCHLRMRMGHTTSAPHSRQAMLTLSSPDHVFLHVCFALSVVLPSSIHTPIRIHTSFLTHFISMYALSLTCAMISVMQGAQQCLLPTIMCHMLIESYFDPLQVAAAVAAADLEGHAAHTGQQHQGPGTTQAATIALVRFGH